MDKMHVLLDEENKVINVIMLDDLCSQEVINLIIQSNNATDIKPIDEDKWWTHSYMGGHYEAGVLWSQKPYPSWIKNYDKKDWAAPIQCPGNEEDYAWNEEALNWEEITE